MLKSGFLYILAIFMLSGCFGDGFIRIKKATESFAQAKAQITNVSIVNDQLVLNGSGLDEVSIVRVTGPSGFDHTLAIESQTSGNLVANGLSTLAFAVGETFNLLLTDAYGAATFPVNFTLQDGSVTASKLDQMGASIGQVLRWSGAAWVAGDLAGLTYAGNWDGTANSPDLTGGGNIGEYYIVNNAGVFNLAGGVGTSSWAVGDWVVWNNVIGQWEKIDNATNVTNFNGRSGPVTPQSGDYTWAQIDKSSSALSDIADVEAPAGDGSDTGKVLKWNNGTSSWELADDLSGGGAGSVTSTEISDGSIVDADINASAAIAQSKINGLTTDLAARLPLAGGTMTGDITFSGTQTFDGVDVSTLNSTVGTQGTSIAANTAAITGLDTDDVAEATNLYFTNARARTAAVLNTTAGTETNQAPSVAAMKSYVSGLGAGDILDGGNTTGSAIRIGTNDAQPLVFETNNTTAMTVTSSGSVGIGTASPSGYNGGTGAKYIELQSVASSEINLQSTGISSGHRSALSFSNQSYRTGFVQISKSATSALDGALTFGTSDGASNATEKMRIDQSGNVGIGTTSPDTKLEVDGTLKIADGGETCTAAGEAGMIRYNTGNLEYCNGSAWQTLGVSGSGLTNFNGETGGTQTLANGATGTAPAFVSATNTHTLNIPLASGAGVTSGTISKTDYDLFAAKQAAITTGTTAQYLRGDLSLSTFETDVINSVLTGYSAGAGTVAATDTVLEALQKLDGNVAAISSDTDGLSEGSTNLYFTNARARTAAVLNSTAGTETDQAASVAAMKTYVAANAGTGDILNGGNTTGAPITIGTNDAQSLNLETNNSTALTVLSNGNVGIGTTSPSSPLNISTQTAFSNGVMMEMHNDNNYWAAMTGSRSRGTASTPTAVQNGDFGAALMNYPYDGASYRWAGSIGFRTDGTVSSGSVPSAIVFNTVTTNGYNNGNAEKMRISSDGNVGIGTTSPGSRFHVVDVYGNNASGPYDVAKFKKDADSTTYLTVENTQGAGTALAPTTALRLITSDHELGGTAEGSLSLRQRTSIPSLGEMVLSAPRNFKVSVGNSGTPVNAMQVSSTGNVGIGSNNSPTAKLHIAGDNSDDTIIRMQDNRLDINDYSELRRVSSRTTLFSRTGNIELIAANDDVTISPGNTLSTTFDSSGSVGIGTTSPDSKLDVEGKVTVGPIDATAGNTGAIAFEELAANGTNSVTMRSPDSLAADYTLTMPADDGDNGEVLTTDGSGVLSWAAAPAATSVSAGAGTAGAPSVAFSTDTDTGLFSGGADVMSFAVGGAEIFSFSTSGITSPTTGGGAVSTANGTAATPTFSFAGDTDTGWYRPAANTLAAATGGSERVRIDSSGRVGIGETSLSARLNVTGSSTLGLYSFTGASGGTAHRISSNDTNAGSFSHNFSTTGYPTFVLDGATGSYIESTISGTRHIRLGNGYTGGQNLSAKDNLQIAFDADNDSTGAFEIVKGSWNGRTGIDGTSLMHIDNDGDVSFGTRTANAKVEIKSSGTGFVPAIKLNNNNSVDFDATGILFKSFGGSTDLRYKGGIAFQRETSFQGVGHLHFLVNGTSDGSNADMTDSKMTVRSNGNVGIGTTAPEARLHVKGSGAKVERDGITNNSGGAIVHTIKSTTSLDMADGYGPAFAFSIEDDAGVDNTISYITAKRDGADNSGSLEFLTMNAGSVTGAMWLDSSGNVGIGTTLPSYKLHVVGSAGKTTGTAWTSISDRRLKDIKGDYEYGLDAIMKLNTVRFNYKEGNELDLPSDNEIVGFIAQEVQKAIPDAVTEREDGFLELNVDPIHWALVNATQEQQAIIEKNISMMKVMENGIETNSRKIASLEKENQEIKQKLTKVEDSNEMMKKQLDAMKAILCEMKPESALCQ